MRRRIIEAEVSELNTEAANHKMSLRADVGTEAESFP